MHGLGLASVLSLMLRIKGREVSRVGTSDLQASIQWTSHVFEPTFFGSVVDVQ